MFFSLAEHGLIRLLDGIVTIVLIRILAPSAFGMFSVYQSWVSFLIFFLPYLELVLAREYGAFKKDGSLKRIYGVFSKYNLLKLILALFFILFAATLPQNIPYSERVMLFIIAAALPLSQSYYGFLQAPLRFEMKQEVVTLISTMQRLVLLLALYLANLFAHGNVQILVTSALLVYLLFAIVWKKASQVVLVPEKIHWNESFGLMKKFLFGTVIWIHINGVITGIVQTLDIYCLNLAKISMDEIGRYSIALKTANFFQILPIGLISTLGVYLGKMKNQNDIEKELELVQKLTLIFMALCFGLAYFGEMIADPLLYFIGKGKVTVVNIAQTREYFIWQLRGFMILASLYPLSTFLGARASLKELTGIVFVPWLFLSFWIYFFASKIDPVSTARMNTLVYSTLNMLFLLIYWIERRSFGKMDTES